MARPTINARKTTVSIRHDLDGWAEFKGRELKADGGFVCYINDLMQADRARVLAADGLDADRYRMYLGATCRDDERASAEDAAGIGGLVGGDDGAERMAGMTRDEWARLTFEDAAVRSADMGVPFGVVAAWVIGKTDV